MDSVLTPTSIPIRKNKNSKKRNKLPVCPCYLEFGRCSNFKNSHCKSFRHPSLAEITWKKSTEKKL